MSAGYVYILTNPSFPDYVKIGYADDVERRLKELNRSECIPFAFRVYATYEVETRLSDKKIHAIIDKLNPNLRAIDDFDGQRRVREFYAMDKEDAYQILEAIAEIHDCTDKLKIWELDAHEAQDEEIAEEIASTRKEAFSFAKCNIAPGEIISFTSDPTKTCTVYDDKRVSYAGEVMSLTKLAQLLTGKNTPLSGPKFFSYKGEPLIY